MAPAEHGAERLVWDDETLARFWNYYAERPQVYFSTAFGPVIARRARRWLSPGGRVLDYGCGAGGLIQAFLGQGVEIGGVDHSAAAVERLSHQFRGSPGFLGVWRPLEIAAQASLAHSFSAIFLIEVIEHLSDDRLVETLAIIRSLLAPGGQLICTTPNDEDLESAMVFCPVSGKVFHPMQHIRNWQPATLAARLREAGFADVVTTVTDFGADFRSFRRQWVVRTAKKLLPFSYKDPHLMARARV
jgi:2-polyprenyl-3-methyl-5-hydroxy-6-metoxy-1,4-benzoquinol methylase